MHLLGRAHDGIHRAGLDAEGAADALVLVDVGHLLDAVFTLIHLHRLGFLPEQVGQSEHHRLAARGAEVDVRLAGGHGLGVGTAAGKAALAALGLGQQGIHLVGDGVAFHLEADGGITEQNPEQGCQRGHGEDGDDHGAAFSSTPGRRSP